MIKLIKTKRYKSAKDFLEDISYGKKMYQNLKDGFVFRGHQSGTYKLVPSVLRHKIHMKDAAGNVLEDDWDAPFNITESEFLQKNLEYLQLRAVPLFVFFDEHFTTGFLSRLKLTAVFYIAVLGKQLTSGLTCLAVEEEL